MASSAVDPIEAEHRRSNVSDSIDSYEKQHTEILELLRGWLTQIKQQNKAIRRKNEIIHRARKELAHYKALAEQRGERLEIVREWMTGLEPSSLFLGRNGWENFEEGIPGSADWFTPDGKAK